MVNCRSRSDSALKSEFRGEVKRIPPSMADSGGLVPTNEGEKLAKNRSRSLWT